MRTDDRGVLRDRHDRPLIHVPGRDKLVAYTRCTTFVDCIEDKTALATWGKRMVLAGAARDPRIITRARTLDPNEATDKQALNHLAVQAERVAGADTKRDQGTHLHTLSEHADRGQPLPGASPADIADLGAYLGATVHLDVVHIERLVVVDSLKVGGTPDRIYHYRGPGPDGEPFAGALIGDLKTGSVERGALKMAMQLAIYSRAVFYDHHTRTRAPLPDVNQRWGLIVHLPAGTAQCTVYWIDLTAGWDAVQVAKRVRELRRTRKLLRPFTASHHGTTDAAGIGRDR
ncbi:hypothetical protein [Paractinoplanes rishiriensis]|uniref:Uncharacterized protein n=1 Tax=Paractinoplanes rishiriensis TaxID=1050105 RepID=A0A919K784_9ACTN|nr:hypothetical protein [Actinoplanes rishiriensis]GIF02242.1 hypothetical protein Ari01nite_97060 [Actinoplanes rishiriensis]